jgi:type I restriction enzyme, S subunit
MRSSYKPLGNYIRIVDFKNLEGREDNLLGVSVSKVFMKSIANTIGTDFTSYRIVKRNQFTYIPDTSRRGDKMGIALLEDIDEGLVSQAYTVFEIIDENQLLPQYLMMWFRRPEFDRYARYMSYGSVREIFSWEEMCNTLLPVPSPDKQREIVKEYNAIQNRIDLNKQLIAKLEEAAQAIYRRWFVEFEFPNDEGKPYKSSGGEMVYNKEFEKEVPKGWGFTSLLDYSILSQGIQVEVEDQLLERNSGMNRFLRIIDYTPNSEEPPRYVYINDRRYYCSEDDLAMIRYGDAGTVCRRFEGIIANNLFKIAPKEPLTNNFLFYFLKDENVQIAIRTSAASSTMPAITHTAIKELPIVLPPSEQINFFDRIVQKAENEILNRRKEAQKLTELKELLLSKLATVKNK